MGSLSFTVLRAIGADILFYKLRFITCSDFMLSQNPTNFDYGFLDLMRKHKVKTTYLSTVKKSILDEFQLLRPINLRPVFSI